MLQARGVQGDSCAVCGACSSDAAAAPAQMPRPTPRAVPRQNCWTLTDMHGESKEGLTEML